MAIKSNRFKSDVRYRRKLRISKKLAGSEDRPRLSVFRSSKHTYAQVISNVDGKTLVSASTREKEVRETIKGLEVAEGRSSSTKSLAAATAVGMVIGKRLVELDTKRIVFDRNGFVYHGRIKAVADGARQAGLEF